MQRTVLLSQFCLHVRLSVCHTRALGGTTLNDALVDILIPQEREITLLLRYQR